MAFGVAHGGGEHRDAGPFGLHRQLRHGLEAAGDQHARNVAGEHPLQRVGAGRGGEIVEEPDLALAEHQDASRVQVRVESGEGQAGLLDVRTGDPA